MTRKSKKSAVKPVSPTPADSLLSRAINDFIAKSLSPRFGAPITALQLAMIRSLLPKTPVATLTKRLKYKSQSALLTDLKRITTGETSLASSKPELREYVASLTEPLTQLHAVHSRVYKMWGRKNSAILFALLTEQQLVKPPKTKRTPRKRTVKPTPAPAPAEQPTEQPA